MMWGTTMPGQFWNRGDFDDFFEDRFYGNYPSVARWQMTERERIQTERSRITASVRSYVYWTTLGHRCGICGLFVSYYEDWEIDHKVPLFLGGTSDFDNLQLTHQYCNRSKGAGFFPYSPWMTRLSGF